ncbi:MAG: D-Ala-D-Ala carboxypeptidase family metallohydrolase [Aeromonas veronii]
MSFSPSFKRSEFACRCKCGTDTVDHELISVLERLRAHYGKPIIITSGQRCTAHNRAVGGSPKSSHLTGRAADFYVKGIPLDVVHQQLIDWYPDRYGIAVGSGFVHVDTRSGNPARWTY